MLLAVSAETLRIIQSVGIVTGICVGVASIWIGVRAIRASNRAAQVKALLDITTSHRDIWRQYASRPELSRVLDWDRNAEEMSEEEQQWLRELILHLSSSYEAGRLGVLPAFDGLDADVRQLISRPMPRAVWRQLRPYQNVHFQKFIGARLAEVDARHDGVPFGLPHSGPRTVDLDHEL